MNNNNTHEIAERFKTAQEFAQDYAAYCNCRGVVQNYVRCDAICLLNALIQRYKSEINEFGFIFDGVHVISGVDYNNMADIQIIDQLIYIGQRIPAYAFIREGNKEIAKRLLNQIGCSSFIF